MSRTGDRGEGDDQSQRQARPCGRRNVGHWPRRCASCSGPVGSRTVAGRSQKQLSAALVTLPGAEGLQLDIGDDAVVIGTLSPLAPFDHLVVSAGGVAPATPTGSIRAIRIETFDMEPGINRLFLS